MSATDAGTESPQTLMLICFVARVSSPAAGVLLDDDGLAEVDDAPGRPGVGGADGAGVGVASIPGAGAVVSVDP